MKPRTFLIVMVAATLILFGGLMVWATLYYGKTHTMEWDAVSTLEDGTQLPQGSALTYEVFLRSTPSGAPVLQGEVGSTAYTYTLPDGQEYDPGVRAVLTIGSQKFYSDITRGSEYDITLRDIKVKRPGPLRRR